MSSRQKKFKLKWAILLAIIAIFSILAYIFFKPKPTPPSYITAEAVMGDIETTVMASGKVKAIQSVDVGAQVSGEIIKLYVDVGSQVKKGDIIAQISEVEQKNTVLNAQASLEQSRASLHQAQANLQNSHGSIASAEATLVARQVELDKAQKAYDRIAELIKIDAVSRQDYDNARADVNVATANVQSARVALQNAKNDVASSQANIASQQAAINKAQNDLSTASEKLAHTTVVAPIDGTVVSVTQKQGTTVNAMQSAPTIVTLADLSRVRINAQISEADVVSVKAGMPARFNIIGNTDQQFDTTLAGIEPAPESISTSSSTDSAVYYIGWLDVDNADGKFRIDMTAQVNIITDWVKNVLTIPASALTKDGGKYTVRVVGADGIATPVEVTVGANNRVTAEIKNGLRVGDKVVIGEGSSNDDKNSNGDNRPPIRR